jgi:hypothetical protein
MKKFTIFFLLTFTFLVTLNSLQAVAPQPPTKGDGSQQNPYCIENLNNLLWLSSTTSVWGKHFIQTADIDATETVNWNSGAGFIPIGGTAEFQGVYDGGGFSIIKLMINRSSNDNIGFFSKLQGATIKNLTISGVNISGKNNVGILSGKATSSIVKNCYLQGNVHGAGRTGGCIGLINSSSVFNISVNSSISPTSTSLNEAGGIAGEVYNSTIRKITSYITISSGSYLGGICGLALSSSFKDCLATGTISGDIACGGFAGDFFQIDDCERCHVSVNVSGNNSVGGFCGSLRESTIKNCYSKGNVTLKSTSSLSSYGGFCGTLNDATIFFCYSTGLVTYQSHLTPVDHGFVGVASGTNTTDSNFFDIDTSGQNIDANSTATGKSTVEMYHQSTYTNWNFSYTWTMTENASYPFFAKISFNGSVHSINIADLSVCATAFTSKPSIYTKYTDIQKGKEKTVKFKVLTKINSKNNITKADYTVNKSIPLYNKSDLAQFLKQGNTTYDWLHLNPINSIPLSVKFKGKVDTSNLDEVFTKFNYTPPVIKKIQPFAHSILTMNGLHTNSVITLLGHSFGIRPKAYLEYFTSKGKLKRKKLQVIANYKYDDIKGRHNRSISELHSSSPFFGDSEMTLKMPSKWDFETNTPVLCDLLIENKSGIDAIKIMVIPESTNTSPGAYNDQETDYFGKKFYLFNILANDLNREADYLFVTLPPKGITNSGGKVVFDKKSLCVKYYPPKDFDKTTTLTDSFTYTISDFNLSVESSATVSITIKP